MCPFVTCGTEQRDGLRVCPSFFGVLPALRGSSYKAFTPQSAEALRPLWAENEGARFKWFLLSLMQLLLE